jgi:glycyl-tRNA synthetase beta chain
MNELLLEFYSEEIPARMQLKAQQQAQELTVELLNSFGAVYEQVTSFVACQRLTICVQELEPLTQATNDSRRGPRIGAPEAALAGFAKITGCNQDQWQQKDGYWYAEILQVGQNISQLLPKLVTSFLDQFSWPKSMRWYNPQTKDFTRTWIRPIRSILCIYNGEPIKFKVEGLDIESSNQTYGHRFLAPNPITVKNFTDYRQQLEKALVILDHQERQKLIQESLNKQAAQLGLTVQWDQNLLEEVAGLVDYPFAHLGQIESEFMHLPAQVLSTSMRVHQKYFSLLKGNQLAPYFGVISNVNPVNNESMMSGYERVLRARLSDAAFFFEVDTRASLETLVPKLDHIIFHAKLGNLGQKVKRLQNLITTEKGKRAALLCKADLLTNMVGEFPELQGTMGEIYALLKGEPAEVALALKEHYQPAGASDDCPTSLLSVELALADKIDSLVGFIGVGIKPTGSKDPFGLRRATLGIIRLLANHTNPDFNLLSLIERSVKTYQEQQFSLSSNTKQEVIQFINDRLVVYLQSQSLSCVPSVLATSKDAEVYNIRSLAERSFALENFLTTSAGTSLKATYRRAAGILDKTSTPFEINPDLLTEIAEKDLYKHIQVLSKNYHSLLSNHEYQPLMEHLAQLRTPIDAFFDTVMVNCDDEKLKNNRFALLQLFIHSVNQIADFSQLQG